MRPQKQVLKIEKWQWSCLRDSVLGGNACDQQVLVRRLSRQSESLHSWIPLLQQWGADTGLSLTLLASDARVLHVDATEGELGTLATGGSFTIDRAGLLLVGGELELHLS